MAAEETKPASTLSALRNWNKRVRWNVLVLFGMGYIAVGLIGWLTGSEIGAKGKVIVGLPFDNVKELLMILVTGTVAVAKDLIRDEEPLHDAGNGTATAA